MTTNKHYIPFATRLTRKHIYLALLALVASISVTACRPKVIATTLPNALRAGNKDYDDYVKAGRLSAVIEKKIQSDSPLKTSELKVTGTITNAGDRTVTGIELHGYAVDIQGNPMVDQNGKPLYHQMHIWMPNQFRLGPMRPGQSEPFQLVITNVQTKKLEEIGDLRIEISAVTFAK